MAIHAEAQYVMLRYPSLWKVAVEEPRRRANTFTYVAVAGCRSPSPVPRTVAQKSSMAQLFCM